MPPHSNEPPPVAYSYIRFSSPEQAKGDSLRRQTAATAAWCERNNVVLDTSVSLRDLGVSAFRGKHRDDTHDLGAFLKLAERSRIPRGSYLVIENLDRLSRENERKALRLWMDILDAGINIVTLTPERVFRHERSDPTDIIIAIIELARGHSESRMKSERLTAVWSEKKRRAREDGKTLTHTLPGWIEERGGKRHVKPQAKATIKRLFSLAARGYGEIRITRLFTKEGVPFFGKSGGWTQSYVRKLLRDRRLLGEFQPRVKATGEPDGEVILDYFPAVLTEAEFYAAQRGRDGRKPVRKESSPIELQKVKELHQQGKTVKDMAQHLGISRQSVYRALIRLGVKKKPAGDKPQGVHLFNGLVRAFWGQRRYVLGTWISMDRPYKTLKLKGHHSTSFPYFVFERAMLKAMTEINAREILDGANGHDDVMAIEGEIGGVESKIAELETELLTGDVGAVTRVLRKLESRLAELNKQLTAARQRAANPLSAAWGETKTLLAALDNAADQEDARVRLRAALRRIIAGIRMAVFTRGRERNAFVEVEFTGEHKNRFRAYTIWYRPRPKGAWAVVSAAGEGPPMKFIPSEEREGGSEVFASDWVQSLPAEPDEWHPLPE
jgi:DNA invertase Pin-like site-specific DNA recombinase